jgi:hypothetical protein
MWIVQVRIRGERKFAGSGIKFASGADAMEWMRRLASRCTLVEAIKEEA